MTQSVKASCDTIHIGPLPIKLHQDVQDALDHPREGCCSNHNKELVVAGHEIRFKQSGCIDLLYRICCCFQSRCCRNRDKVKEVIAATKQYLSNSIYPEDVDAAEKRVLKRPPAVFRLNHLRKLRQKAHELSTYRFRQYKKEETKGIKLAQEVEDACVRERSCCGCDNKELIVEKDVIQFRKCDLIYRIFCIRRFCCRASSKKSFVAVQEYFNSRHLPIIVTRAEGLVFGPITLPKVFCVSHLRELFYKTHEISNFKTNESDEPNSIKLHPEVVEALDYTSDMDPELIVKGGEIQFRHVNIFQKIFCCCFPRCGTENSHEVLNAARKYLERQYTLAAIYAAERRVFFKKIPDVFRLNYLRDLGHYAREITKKYFDVDWYIRWLNCYASYLELLKEDLEKTDTPKSDSESTSTPKVLMAKGGEIAEPQEITVVLLYKILQRIPMSNPQIREIRPMLQGIIERLKRKNYKIVNYPKLIKAMIRQIVAKEWGIRDPSIVVNPPLPDERIDVALIQMLRKHRSADELSSEDWEILLRRKTAFMPRQTGLPPLENSSRLLSILGVESKHVSVTRRMTHLSQNPSPPDTPIQPDSPKVKADRNHFRATRGSPSNSHLPSLSNHPFDSPRAKPEHVFTITRESPSHSRRPSVSGHHPITSETDQASLVLQSPTNTRSPSHTPETTPDPQPVVQTVNAQSALPPSQRPITRTQSHFSFKLNPDQPSAPKTQVDLSSKFSSRLIAAKSQSTHVAFKFKFVPERPGHQTEGEAQLPAAPRLSRSQSHDTIKFSSRTSIELTSLPDQRPSGTRSPSHSPHASSSGPLKPKHDTVETKKSALQSNPPELEEQSIIGQVLGLGPKSHSDPSTSFMLMYDTDKGV